MDEFGFIASLLAPLAEGEKGALGLKDDAAVLDIPPGQELVVTKDAIVQGVHFIGDEPASLIARKLLRVNLSDLAAMGATPRAYFLALMLPGSANEAWLADFADGLRMDGQEYGITLMGGDTVRTPGPLALSLTALGTVPRGQALTRSGAKPGDAVYVTGTIGDGALGLQIANGTLQAEGSVCDLQQATRDHLLQRYRLPRPRLALAGALRSIATACIDISDGLMQDLEHICTASGAGAEIRWPDIPLSEAAWLALGDRQNPYEIILAGGDDYELLFTVPLLNEQKLQEAAKASGVSVTRIGQVTEGKEVVVLDAQEKEIILARRGYRHF